MSSCLDKVIEDFEDEVDALKHERFSTLRYALKKILRSLRMIDDVVWDSGSDEMVTKLELSRILTEAETELGGILRSNRRQKISSDHHQRITSLLTKLTAYREELHPSSSLPHTGSFRVPLFTRSDSFKSVDYQLPDSDKENLQRISVRIEKKTVEATMEFGPKPPTKPNLNRCSAPSRPPPPPPPGKAKSKAKNPEISRLPKVISAFRAKIVENAPSKKKLPVQSSHQGNPTAVIEELKSKSKHTQKINEEVELYREMIKSWAEEINTVTFSSMDELVTFVQRMDKNISDTLTDEVIILKQIGNWPKRYDLLREASAAWNQLKQLESLLLEWRLQTGEDFGRHFKQMQELLDKADSKLQCLMRHYQQEQARFNEAGIPWNLTHFETVKAAALVPIELYLNAVHDYSGKVQSTERRRELFANCAQIAFKGHQFVGGFNASCTQAFALIEKASEPLFRQPNPCTASS